MQFKYETSIDNPFPPWHPVYFVAIYEGWRCLKTCEYQFENTTELPSVKKNYLIHGSVCLSPKHYHITVFELSCRGRIWGFVLILDSPKSSGNWMPIYSSFPLWNHCKRFVECTMGKADFRYNLDLGLYFRYNLLGCKVRVLSLMVVMATSGASVHVSTEGCQCPVPPMGLETKFCSLVTINSWRQKLSLFSLTYSS